MVPSLFSLLILPFLRVCPLRFHRPRRRKFQSVARNPAALCRQAAGDAHPVGPVQIDAPEEPRNVAEENRRVLLHDCSKAGQRHIHRNRGDKELPKHDFPAQQLYEAQEKKNQQHRIGQNKPRGMIEYRHFIYGADALQNRNAEYYRKNQQPASNAVALLPGGPQPLHRPLHLRYPSPCFFPVYHAVIDKPSDLTII